MFGTTALGPGEQATHTWRVHSDDRGAAILAAAEGSRHHEFFVVVVDQTQDFGGRMLTSCAHGSGGIPDAPRLCICL